MTMISDRKHWSKPELSTLSVEKTLGGDFEAFLECEIVSGSITGEKGRGEQDSPLCNS